MFVRQEFGLSGAAVQALGPALDRSNIGWRDIENYMHGLGWCVWNIGDTGYVFTLSNEDSEIEVLLAGGRQAKGCVTHWEAAMKAHPGHKGKTLRIDGRQGWKRLLPHWNCEESGVLTLKVV